MQFFVLIIINLVMWAVFYLVISLKLEKSATQFREEKLRKVMDDIINEFNIVSERNISILENKINVVKKLLNKTGEIRAVDITIDDEKDIETKIDNINIADELISNNNISPRIDRSSSSVNVSNVKEIDLKNILLALSKKIIDIFQKTKELLYDFLHRTQKDSNIPNTYNQYIDGNVSKEQNNIIDKKNKVFATPLPEKELQSEIPDISEDFIIQKDLSQIVQDKEKDFSDEIKGDIEKETELDENEISSMFESATDRYSLIADLFKMGYPVEKISKCSGMPVGEVKLVLNLNYS